MNRIKYEVHDLGVDYPDYFQGFGVAHTKYEHSSVGMGDCYNSALDNALRCD